MKDEFEGRTEKFGRRETLNSRAVQKSRVLQMDATLPGPTESQKLRLKSEAGLSRCHLPSDLG